ncbi:MAG: MurR/RpiR family transcriptional regulator [Oscillospiraceae bacterium]|nr:MurR/RpiR family transcriptional regulator [Oscillospiraceae bacterium]
MSENVLSAIRARYNTLSLAQQRVADYVLQNAGLVMTSSLADLADACAVSEPTVIRFLRKLDCESYQVFRVGIARELALDKPEAIYEELSSRDAPADIVSTVLASTARAIEDAGEIIDPASLSVLRDRAAEARRIFIIGMGASAAPAFDLRHKLLKLGMDADFSHDPHMINIMCGNLNERDLLVAFSHSGESRETLDGVRIAKANGCFAAAVTSYGRSSLAMLADCLLLSSSRETRYRSDAMTSRIIQMTIIDMIYLSLALKIGDSARRSIDRSRLAVAKNKT